MTRISLITLNNLRPIFNATAQTLVSSKKRPIEACNGSSRGAVVIDPQRRQGRPNAFTQRTPDSIFAIALGHQLLIAPEYFVRAHSLGEAATSYCIICVCGANLF